MSLRAGLKIDRILKWKGVKITENTAYNRLVYIFTVSNFEQTSFP